jgi:putative ABC transport system permease protein
MQDLRYGLRMLTTNPGFTAVALITLVLGIGANSALFTLTQTFLVGPHEFPNADELVHIWGVRTDLRPEDFRGGIPRTGVNGADFLDWRRQALSFEEIALYRGSEYVLTGGDRPERVQAVQTTSGLLPMLGIEASIGRLFGSDEESDPVVLLTDPLWSRRFGRSPEVLGRTLMLNDVPHTVIGVLSREINRTTAWDDVDVWTPLHIDPAVVGRGDRNLSSMARLAPGVTTEQAQAELSGIAAGLAEMYPDSNANRGVLVQQHGTSAIVAEERLAMQAVLAAVAFVLVIACLNLANLFLVRASARMREFAIRASLGAHRRRIVRQLLTESALLALIGGALGMLLGNWILDVLTASIDPEILQQEGIDLSLDTAVVGYTLLLSLGCAMVFGLGPALRVSRVPVNEALKKGATAGTEGSGRLRTRSVFVAGQIMIVLPLLVCCGMAIRSAIAQSSIELGFDPEQVITMRIHLPEHRYAEPERQKAFFDELLQAARSKPGMEGVAVASSVPFSFYWSSREEFLAEGRERDPDSEPEFVPATSISPRYFEVLDTVLVRGRDFTEHDLRISELVAIVNQRLARLYWPDEDVLGKRLRLGSNSGARWLKVVGVVANTCGMMIDQPPQPEVFLPYAQQPEADMYLLARTTGDPMEAASSLREVVARLDKDQPVHDIQSMNSLVQQFIGGYEITAQGLGSLAVIASVLAGIGLAGVISINITQRTHELGIRMALGALPGEVLRVVLRQVLRLVAIGLMVGLVVSVVAANVLAGRFYGVSPHDPVVFFISMAVLAAFAIVACYFPARRATRIEPAVALRYE